ncbi:MAG: hypothetical protein DRP78_02055 [Candidatus Omnitrophota bacterium]|nr:MAG: hypothetical protein DRP78_02055 [Candidatus Omnitrophota bacterium]
MKNKYRVLYKKYWHRIVLSIVLLGLCFGKVCFSQQGSTHTVKLASNFLPHFAAYSRIMTKKILDADNNANFCDPSALSVFLDLAVTGDINVESMIEGHLIPPLPGLYPQYFINLDPSLAVGPAIYCDSLQTVDTITMGADSPLPLDGSGNPLTGKHVYDIAEAITGFNCMPADVVVISRKQDLTVEVSGIAFDVRVAGVISTEPKLLMGTDSGKVPLALAGIVQCKVTNENGRIISGDLLVTASKPGYAMRADKKDILAGMLVGKALEPLDADTGKIYILVN